MTLKAMWEVDPETRSKLLEIQKTNSNDRCCDCGAPSPQWASPKFGIFMCLSCAGIHRGLGVHISFVRSITMDSFKSVEIERMRLGGNKPWREFYEQAESKSEESTMWDDSTISERYSGEVGEEWKERLSAKVEGKEYTPSIIKCPATKSTKSESSSTGPLSRSRTSSNFQKSPTHRPGEKAKVDTKYFEGLAVMNASRSVDLPPSQGGKYSGFGSQPLEPLRREPSLPKLEDLQKDPVAALTKGFGWFTTNVGRTVKTVNEDYIQPTAKSVAGSDIAAQARIAATQVALGAQTSAKSAATNFTKFIEGNNSDKLKNSTGSYLRIPVNDSKNDYWDDFGDIANHSDTRFQNTSLLKSSSVGTNAIKKASGAGHEAGMTMKKCDEAWERW